LASGSSDLVLLAGPLPLAVGLDQPVALETLEGRVDLADVQRPDVAGPGFELVLQALAVLRALAEEGEECVRDAHCAWLVVVILSNILSMVSAAQVESALRHRR